MSFLNKSEDKIRVIKQHAAGSAVGLMDPKVDMHVYCGEDQFWITGFVDSSGVIKLGLSSGAAEVALQVYSHEVGLLYTTATGEWDFPNAAGSVTFGEAPAAASTGLNKFVQNNAGTPRQYTYAN